MCCERKNSKMVNTIVATVIAGAVAVLFLVSCSPNDIYRSREKLAKPASSPTPQPAPSPAATPEPLVATFESIHENILVPKCIGCHSSGGRAEHIPLGTEEDLLNSPRELVIPGNPDESTLVLAIERDDEKRMPPPPRRAALSDEEKRLIREWIANLEVE